MSEWIQTESGMKYKIISTNGKWNVLQIKGNGAYYSCCPECGFSHSCYKLNDPCTKASYDKANEYKYCPMCGISMDINKDNEE
jgi:rubredoxin